MSLFNFNLLTSHLYKKVTEELKLISYIWKEFKVCNSFKFKHFTDSLLKQSSDFIVRIFFLFKFKEEVIIITVINFYIKDSVSLFFFFIDWLSIQLNCSQSMQLNYSQSIYLLLNILLNIKKKFTIFNEVKSCCKEST